METPRPLESMLCPVCKVSLHMTERQGVEIDYCPQCRGVWLDRGELDKILERSRQEVEAAAPPAAAPPAAPYPQQAPPVSYGPPAAPPPAYGQRPPQGGYYKDGRYWQDEHQYKEYKKRKKRSFFEDLFD